MGWAAEVGSSILLFFLVFGMSATVELKQLKKQIQNRTALLIGMTLQFFILPFCGFVVVNVLRLPPAMGIILLVVTSSPGGSYSNWWCSMFNADLALSVTMTAISTLLSTIMLPTNLVLYARHSYNDDVVEALDWTALFVSLVVVIGGISCGLISSAASKQWALHEQARFHRRANFGGNLAGLALITLSITVSSTDHQASLLNQGPAFYIGIALPAFIGLGIATWLATKFDLDKPERVAVAVEACYQNTGIATSVALNMFSGQDSDLATAIGVPLYYGIVEATLLACFCLVCWKLGWTKAPKDENICLVIFNSYEVEEDETQEPELAIEVVLGGPEGKAKEGRVDLVFEQNDQGAYIVDVESLERVKNFMKHQEVEDATAAENSDDSIGNTMSSVNLEVATPTKMPKRQRLPSGESESPTVTTTDSNIDEENVELPSTPQTSTEEEGSDKPFKERLTTAAAIIRARAVGYRRPPPQAELAYEQDHSVLSVLDEDVGEEIAREKRICKYNSLSNGSPEVKEAPSSQGKSID